ncbi:MAG: UDP-N-acetylmuramate:L-alanyl-gamma-D-glutamyl-meso-diaminopimelate ligase [Xanthomonadales bacterium]|nr:UDP-N-acetylmuramate:L-alanyl-gamma-D-glutamyl-meso-diaminopimelate ligase [Xanthomonadales bacterium]
MNIHILGICGTFMGGVALLARHLGHRVSGSDGQVYPPMSTLLADQGIDIHSGYTPANIEADTDLIIIGNALSRGNPAVEYVLNQGLKYCSGPQWLGEHFLGNTTTVAVAGTHGKTTTSSMVAWILERAGLNPGFLIGGVPGNFDVSAQPGDGRFFVVEADEYDTAFFDKRSKFVHYRPRVAVLNNLEYDHADIFPDLRSIQVQFHHLVRTIPGNGQLVVNATDNALAQVLEMGCWTPVTSFSAGASSPGDWRGEIHANGDLSIIDPSGDTHRVNWQLSGQHNLMNAMAAVAASLACGVPAGQSVAALAEFRNPARRQQLLFQGGDTELLIYDDFAHHPTAIAATLAGLRTRHPQGRLVAVLEPRSNSMRSGAHLSALAESVELADQVYLLAGSGLSWNPDEELQSLGQRLVVADTVENLLASLCQNTESSDCIVFMSNGGFGGIQSAFVGRISELYGPT